MFRKVGGRGKFLEAAIIIYRRKKFFLFSRLNTGTEQKTKRPKSIKDELEEHAIRARRLKSKRKNATANKREVTKRYTIHRQGETKTGTPYKTAGDKRPSGIATS